MERISLADLHSAEVVGDVDGPGGACHSGKGPGGKETVDVQDDQVKVLDPLVEEYLAQFHHLKLAPDGDFKCRVLSNVQVDKERVGIIFTATVKARWPLCLLKILQCLQEDNRT